MSELRKDSSGGSVAAQADMDVWQGELSALEVKAYITAEAADIDALVTSGDIEIEAESGTSVKITFDEDATGDKASTLKMLASHLSRRGSRVAAPAPEDPEDPPLPAPAEWTATVGDAKSWVSRCQSYFGLWE